MGSPMEPDGRWANIEPPTGDPREIPWGSMGHLSHLVVPLGVPCGNYPIPWSLIEPHGTPWDTMEPHGIQWCPMEYLYDPVELHGSPCDTYPTPWETPGGTHPTQWDPIGHHRVPILSHGALWCLMGYSSVPMPPMRYLSDPKGDPVESHGAPWGNFSRPYGRPRGTP